MQMLVCDITGKLYLVCFMCARQVKICHLEPLREQRVKVFGWVHRLRRQGNARTHQSTKSGMQQCKIRSTLMDVHVYGIILTQNWTFLLESCPEGLLEIHDPGVLDYKVL